jgi:predicted AAA+ superfamily ATPase
MALNMNATPETVWALLQEVAQLGKELRESQKETDKKFQETREDIKELSKNIGGVNNSLGDVAEGLMASDLYETFEALGLDFDHSFQNYKVKEKETKRTLAEVDMLLVNGTIAMAVEVKTTMKEGDVDKHETRMDVLRHDPNSLFANRKLYGAMAGVKMSPQAREYAADKGFFVIELTGDTIKVDMPEGWTPKTW